MSGDTCSNCGEGHSAQAVFCENCGLDFLTGSLPEPEPAITSIAGQSPTPTVQSSASLTIAVDPEYHRRTDVDDVLDLPEPLPAPIVIPLVGQNVLLGRSRPSRGLFPDVDLGSDPAVSSRHAQLTHGPDGWTITAPGSTNGTFVGESTVALVPDTPMAVTPGTSIHLGAWTRLVLTESEPVS